MLCVRTIRFFLYPKSERKKQQQPNTYGHINNFCDQRLANMYVMCTCRSAICHIYVSLEDFILPQTKTIMNSQMKFHGASVVSLHRQRIFFRHFDSNLYVRKFSKQNGFFAFSIHPKHPNGFDTRKASSF